MDLTNPADLKALLERHGLTPRKRWGQHFLTSSRVVTNITQRLEGFEGVLEIGPGPGVLTAIASTNARVIAVEVDSIAVSALGETAPRAEVIAGDALKIDLRALLQRLPVPRAVLSNMPYNITGPLIFAIFDIADSWSRAVLMMQKEVGDRILAKPGSGDYAGLSVVMQTRFDIEKVCDAPSGAFFPPPKVDSVVLQLTPKTSGPNAAFYRLVRQGFKQPRKTLLNNLQSAGYEKPGVLAALTAVGMAEQARPHQLDLDQWRRLWEEVGDDLG